MSKFTFLITAVCAAAFSAGAAGAAGAAEFPDKPLKIIVPYSAGGGVDSIARIVGRQLSTRLGQPVVVENRPGANANLGADLVAKAPADGYTLLLSANTLATSATLFPHTPFNVLRDFAPVARIGYAPLVLVVPSSSPIHSVKELVAAAKQQPGKLNYSSSGNGSSQHLAGEMLKSVAQIDVLHIPYKGGAPALTDLLGGRITYMFQNPFEVISHIRANQLRSLMVGSEKRLPLLPEVPTAAEAGLRGFEASVWWGVVAPVKTPHAVVTRLNAEITTILNDPEVKSKLADIGVVTTPGTPEQFGEFLKLETDRWAKVIKAAGIHAD